MLSQPPCCLTARGCRRARGVTLLESCIALSLAAFVLTGTAGSMAQAIERLKLRSASAQLASDIQYARYLAITRSQSLRLSVLSSASGSCYAIHTGTIDDCECAASDDADSTRCSAGQVLRARAWPQAGAVALSSNVRSIVFDPLMGTSSPTGTLRLSSRTGLTVRHVVNLMGRVRVCAEGGQLGGHAAC